MMSRRRRLKEQATDPDDNESAAALLTPVSPSAEHMQRTADIARGITPVRPKSPADPRASVVEVTTDAGDRITIASVEGLDDARTDSVVRRILRRVQPT